MMVRVDCYGDTSIGELVGSEGAFEVLGEFRFSFREVNWDPIRGNWGCRVERLL